MAHSLFEPAPPNLSEKLWQRVKDINLGLQGRRNEEPAVIATAEDATLVQQIEKADARGRQLLLAAAMAESPAVARRRKPC